MPSRSIAAEIRTTTVTNSSCSCGAVIGAFMLFGFGVPRWKKSKAVIFGFVSLAAYVLIALAVFNRWLIWLPGVMPLGIVAVCILFRVVTPDSFGRPKKPVIF